MARYSTTSLAKILKKEARITSPKRAFRSLRYKSQLPYLLPLFNSHLTQSTPQTPKTIAHTEAHTYQCGFAHQRNKSLGVNSASPPLPPFPVLPSNARRILLPPSSNPSHPSRDKCLLCSPNFSPKGRRPSINSTRFAIIHIASEQLMEVSRAQRIAPR